MRRYLLLAGLSLPFLAVSASAQRQPSFLPCPPVTAPVCPPLLPGQPSMPGQPYSPGQPSIPGQPSLPGQPGQPSMPGSPTDPGGTGSPNIPSMTPGGTGAPGDGAGTGMGTGAGQGTANPFGQATEGGGLASNSYANNMFGDLLGTRPVRFSYNVPITARFGLVNGATTGDGGPGVRVDPNLSGGTITFGPTPNGTTRTSAAKFTQSDLSYVQPTINGGVAGDRAFAQAVLQGLLNNGGLTKEQIDQFNRLSPADREALIRNRGAINGVITNATRGLNIGNVTVSNVDATINGSEILYTAILTGESSIVLPGAGSTVGRVKISEDNNPFPRDRIIFNYDYFEGVPFTATGFNVSRFQFGIEKTFLDGRWSGEFRLPFAATLNSTYTQGAESSNTEVGNVRFALKRLWLTSQYLSISTGLGLTLPTAADQVVLSPLGGELLRFKNQTVTLEPFIAALFTPTERLFGQLWTSVNADVSGGELRWDRNVFGGSGSARIVDLPTLSVDGQVGYWLVKPDAVRRFGLAPFIELHWNSVLAQNELTNEVNKRTGDLGLQVQTFGSQELNLTAGFYAQISDVLTIGLGGTAPMLRRPDRTFDGQFGLRVNYFFGRTAAERSGFRSVNMY